MPIILGTQMLLDTDTTSCYVWHGDVGREPVFPSRHGTGAQRWIGLHGLVFEGILRSRLRRWAAHPVAEG